MNSKESNENTLEREKTALMNVVNESLYEFGYLGLVKDLEELSFAFVSFKDEGPTPIAHLNLNFTKEDPEDLLTKIGILLMTIVGQGSGYFEGLYGPFPINGYKDQLAYVYSFFVHDGSTTDHRTQNQAYSILVLFFPRLLANYLQSSFKIINQVLSHTFKDVTDIIHLTEPLLKRIKEQLKFTIDYWLLLSLGSC